MAESKSKFSPKALVTTKPVKGNDTFLSDSAEKAGVEPNEATFSKTVTNGSDEVIEMYCELCNRNWKSNTASSFCISCMDYLCSTCLCSHGWFLPDHIYLEGDTMPEDVCFEKCPIHKTEIIKFYCETCNKIGCSVCRKHDHQEMCIMKFICDIVTDLQIEKDAEHLIFDRDRIVKRLSDTESGIDTLYKDINRVSSEIKLAIEKEKECLFRCFDLEANKIEKNIRATQINDAMCVASVKEKLDPLNTEISKFVSGITQLPAFSKSRKYKLLVELKHINQRLNHVIHDFEDLSKYNFASYDVLKFKFTKDMNDLSKKVKEFGRFAKGGKGKTKETNEKCERKFARYLGDINVSSRQDTDDCHIVDFCLLSNQYLIACDKNNRSVKLIDTASQRVIFVRYVKTFPEAATKINDFEFAMVQPYDKDMERSVIQFLTITDSKKLDFHQHFILTEMYCVNIVYVNDNILIISMWANHEGKVQILSMDGIVLFNIENNSEGCKLFRCPDYITLDATGVQLYVSDWYRDSVIEIDLRNKSIRELEHRFWHPEGITTDGEGFVYVCESGTGRVHVFYPDKSDTHVLLEKHSLDWRPLSLCFSVTDNILYVGQTGQNSIKMFKITNSEATQNDVKNTV